MSVQFKGLPLPPVGKDDKAEDVLRLGKVVSRLLRAHSNVMKDSDG